MKNYKLTFSTIKIATIFSIMTLVVVATSFDLRATTAAFSSSIVQGLSNKVEAGVWTPDVPTNLGWNIPSESTTPNEGNPDNLDLACGDVTNGGDSNAPRISHNWSNITGANIVYQREVTSPDTHIAYFYETDNFTSFVSFGSGAGIQGLWNTRVRSFEDINTNGVYDDGVDVASDWSNYCEITLDTAGPELSYTNIPLAAPLLSIDANFNIIGSVIDDNLASYQVVIVESDVAGLTEGAEVANYILDPALPSALQRILHTWDISALDGYYKVKLSAVDSLGNAENIEEVVLIENSTTPTSTITISNSPEKEMDNRIVNSGFEDEINGWMISGAVSVTENDADIRPFEGSSMLRLGHVDGMNEEASISQKINNNGIGLRSVGFWYNVVTTEQNGDSTEPSFAVYLGDEMVYQVWAKDFQNNDGTAISDWKYASIYLVERTGSELELKMVAIDQDAVAGSTQVYLDGITTDTTIINESAILSITADEQAENSTVYYRYTVNGREYTANGQSGLTFSIAAQPDDRLIEHWTVDGLGKEGQREQIYVIYDNQAPSEISNLAVYEESESNYTLSFTSPTDNISPAVSKYEIRYSLEEITEETWNSASIVDLKVAPRTSGQEESLLVEGLETMAGYYFAIKSTDATNRWSEISNVAVSQQFSEIEGGVEGLGILINEAKSLSDGNYVELYNLTDTELDLEGWIIKSNNSHTVISKENSDNNLSKGDSGETIIPVNAYLVVKVNTLKDFISLSSSNGLTVDEVAYSGSSLEGFSEGRAIDGSEQWIENLLLTFGRKNTSNLADLDPQIMIEQQEAYNVKIGIIDALNYDTADYQIEYSHLFEGQEVSESVTGSMEIDSMIIEKDSIYFATCSTGNTCAPHLDIISESIILKVTLSGSDVQDIILESELKGDWTEPDPEEKAKMELELLEEVSKVESI